MSDLWITYKSWILAQQLEDCTLREDAQGNLLIENEQYQGHVNLYDIDGTEIIELRLERVIDGKPEFFLHFELVDLKRSQELFNEMAEVIYDLLHAQMQHILVCCTVGMTSTYFALKLNEAAKNMGIRYDFAALSIEAAKHKGDQYVAVLLAPQVGYLRNELAAQLPDTLVIEIPAKVFGTYDANTALRLLTDALSGAPSTFDAQPPQLSRSYDDTKQVLALSYVIRKDEPTLSYRVLDHGTIVASGMLIRRSITISTIKDITATLRIQGWQMSDFDAIGVAVPGIVNDGVVIEELGETEVRHSLKSQLEELFGTTVYVDYNATAAAVGCYVSQDEYENVAFHAQAIGMPDGEEGYVIEGRPLTGREGRSGHLGPLAKGFSMGIELEDASWRVPGMCELVARYISCLACTIAPEVIYVWCDLLPDMDELRNELLKILPKSAVPELRAVADYDGYVLLGVLALCLQRLAQS